MRLYFTREQQEFIRSHGRAREQAKCSDAQKALRNLTNSESCATHQRAVAVEQKALSRTVFLR